MYTASPISHPSWQVPVRLAISSHWASFRTLGDVVGEYACGEGSFISLHMSILCFISILCYYPSEINLSPSDIDLSPGLSFLFLEKCFAGFVIFTFFGLELPPSRAVKTKLVRDSVRISAGFIFPLARQGGFIAKVKRMKRRWFARGFL